METGLPVFFRRSWRCSLISAAARSAASAREQVAHVPETILGIGRDSRIPQTARTRLGMPK